MAVNFDDIKTIYEDDIFIVKRTYDEDTHTFTYICMATASLQVSEEYVTDADVDTLEREISQELLDKIKNLNVELPRRKNIYDY